MEDGSASCDDPGCPAWRFDRYAALQEGWVTVDGQLFCPDHGHIAVRKARQAKQWEELQQRANAIEAKQRLSAGDYRAWDEFQTDLANFHREHGKPAHRELRILSPHGFVQRHRAHGRIDIKLATEAMEVAERAFDKHRIERLKGS